MADPNYLEMSDEEILNAPAPTDEPVVAQVVEETPAEPAPVVEAEDKPDEELPDAEAVAADEDGGTPAKEDAKADEEVEPKGEKAPVEAETPKDDKPKVEAPVVDYEAEYKRLLAPFKANGREIQVGSVDDALSLMQMGANYNKKMAGLKPSLKLMKMLENNGLLSEEKIGFLIDLEKKNPEAINKLVKESGINPMDLDAEKAGEYKPKTHTVDDREMELDTVLDDIQSTPSYNRTLAIVSKEWDGKSKQVIADQPQLLKLINDHVERGIYDLISKEVESGRMLGRLNGLSDIEAYRQVGDAIQARGGFNHLGSSQGKPSPAPVVVQPKPKKVDDDKLNDKRRAASSSTPVVSSAVAKEFNPLSLSDEEFNKLSAPVV
jgi:hypothetical protein